MLLPDSLKKALCHFRRISGLDFTTLRETAKENKLNPFACLNHLFEKLPNLESRDSENLDQLMS